MNRIKTLSAPLVAALLASVALPADAQVRLELSTYKSYRQSQTAMKFKGGTFNTEASDGLAIKILGCDNSEYYTPTLGCPGGSTALLTAGSFGFATPFDNPYIWVTTITPGVIIEPLRPELVKLRAAPASKLPRPAGGFADDSYTLFYNLHQYETVREYTITGYTTSRSYLSTERSRFEKEIVKGVYHYGFPRLKLPNLVVPISATIYPMPEGIAKLNNRKTGVQFETKGQSWDPDGFLKLSVNGSSIVKWSGFSPSIVFAGVDRLYFSLRFMSNPAVSTSDAAIYSNTADPNGFRYINPADPANTDTDDDTIPDPASIFPPFVTGGSPRVLLANPYVTSFTLPPTIPSGTKAIAMLELARTFQTSGVAYDYSTRTFEIPVAYYDNYAEYRVARFGPTTVPLSGLDQDFDGDAFTNFTEWILGSNPANAFIFPTSTVASTLLPPVFLSPVPALIRTAASIPAVFDPNTFEILTPASFGFKVTKKQLTDPVVTYTLLRSTDLGLTWAPMVTDANWTVTDNAATVSIISNILGALDTPIQPPGTATHLYRIALTHP